MSVNMTYITENKMQVKNISARGWWVMGKMVAPGATETVEATVSDIGDNPDLEIVYDTAEDPAQTIELVVEDEPVVEDEQAPEVIATPEPEKRKPGRPAK